MADPVDPPPAAKPALAPSADAAPVVRILVRPNGPLKIEGPVTLFDETGRKIIPPPTDKARLALCSCGRSAEKPFCDGSHRIARDTETGPSKLSPFSERPP